MLLLLTKSKHFLSSKYVTSGSGDALLGLVPAQGGMVLFCYHFCSARCWSCQRPESLQPPCQLPPCPHKHLQPLHPCSAPEGNNFSPKQNPRKAHIKSVLQARAPSGEGAHRVHCSHVAVSEARKSRKRGVRPQKSPKGRAPSWAPAGPWAWQVAGWWLQLHSALGSLS